MTASGAPSADIAIDDELVRSLVAEQHPDLASLEVRSLAFGWDNAVYRLGADLVVRLPRREVAVELLVREQRWLPELAPLLPLPIPSPLRIGTATASYPWPWSICPWLPGDTAAVAAPVDGDAAALAIGSFLRALHVEAPVDAPRNPYRGIPLADRTYLLLEALEKLPGAVDRDAVLAQWSAVTTVPRFDGAPRWIHGDLHPANVLVTDGRISSVIDFGDLAAGDPATDLSVAWMLLPSGARARLREAAGDVDDATWTRARGWALALSLAYLAGSADDPTIRAIGERTLRAVMAD